MDLEHVQQNCNEIVNFVLNNSGSMLPMKLSDMTPLVTDGTFKQCFSAAKTTLVEKFGLQLLEVPDKGPKKFILISQQASVCLEQLDEEQTKHTQLIFLILAYIFMRDTIVIEEDLVMFLLKLGINIDEQHDYFGSDLRKLITETFPKQLYLKRTKSVDTQSSTTRFGYSWGYRSCMEFDKMDMLEKVAKLLGTPMQSFVSQYARAQQPDDHGAVALDHTVQEAGAGDEQEQSTRRSYSRRSQK